MNLVKPYIRQAFIGPRNLGFLLATVATLFWMAAAQSNPIDTENSQPGTNQFWLSNPANDIDQQIKGYASATSVNKGGSITFYVTVAPAQTYNIEIYRIGWYGGARGRLLDTIGPLNGSQQSAPVEDLNTGRVTAQWTPSYNLTIPSSWTNGVYLAKLINADGYENYIIFAVRDDGRSAPFLVQIPVTTYQAYNAYPSGGIGKSLYDYNSSPSITVTGSKRAAEVSFDRPYEGDGSGQFFSYDFYLVGWLESAGYDVAYTTNIDVHRKGASYLQRYQSLLSSGHDEYWSKAMYDAAENARDSGTDIAFFGSNAVYWQIRLDPSADGTPNRVVTCYKNGADPIADASLKTILWRNLGRAEQSLVGVQYITFGDQNRNTDFIVRNADHWAYADTGLANGDRIPKIIGYEVDGLFTEYPKPVSSNQTLLSESPYTDIDGKTAIAQSSIYQAPSGAWVFATGTMSWSWGLGKSGFTNSGLQKTTANILDKFVNPDSPPPPGGETCSTFISQDVPVFLQNQSSRVSTAASSIPADKTGAISSLKVIQINGGHSREFRNTSITLTSPQNKTMSLVDGCSKRVRSFNFNLDDNASKSLTSRTCLPSDGGDYKPSNALAQFNGNESSGTWKLSLSTRKSSGDGSLNSWGLEVCTE